MSDIDKQYASGWLDAEEISFERTEIVADLMDGYTTVSEIMGELGIEPSAGDFYEVGFREFWEHMEPRA